MTPRLRWGLITGTVVALLNLCGGTLIGAFNNCLSIVTVTVAAAIAGYFCARQEPSTDAVKAGGVAGMVVGIINLVSQLIGGVIGGLVGTGLLASFTSQVQADPASFTQGVGIGLGIIMIAALGVGVILILLGAGVGALTAKIAMPKSEVTKQHETINGR